MVKIGIDFDALGKGVLDWGCREVSEGLYISVLVWVCTRAHRDQRSMTDVFLGHSSPYFLRPGLTEPGACWSDHAVHQPHLGILLPWFLQCWDDMSLSTASVNGFWELKVNSWLAWQVLHQLCHFPTQRLSIDITGLSLWGGMWTEGWIGVTIHSTTSQHVLGYLGVFEEKTKSFHGCGKLFHTCQQKSYQYQGDSLDFWLECSNLDKWHHS